MLLPWQRGKGKDAAAVATGQEEKDAIAMATGRGGRMLLPWQQGRGDGAVAIATEELAGLATERQNWSPRQHGEMRRGRLSPWQQGPGRQGCVAEAAGGGFGQHPLPWDRTGTQLSPPSQAPRVLAPREAAPKICQDGHEGGHGPAGVLRGLSVSSVSRALCGYGKKSRAVRAVMATATCRQGRTKRLSFFVHLTALCWLSDRDNAMRPLL